MNTQILLRMLLPQDDCGAADDLPQPLFYFRAAVGLGTRAHGSAWILNAW
jgi:hypothetical protein